MTAIASEIAWRGKTASPIAVGSYIEPRIATGGRAVLRVVEIRDSGRSPSVYGTVIAVDATGARREVWLHDDPRPATTEQIAAFGPGAIL